MEKMFDTKAIMTIFPIYSLMDPTTVFWTAIFVAGIWLVMEMVFWYVVSFIVAPQLNKLAKPVPLEGHPGLFLDRIMTTVVNLSCYTMEEYFEGFFLKAKFEDIHYGNVFSFVAWAVFGKHTEHLHPRETKAARKFVEHLKQKYECFKNLKPGTNPDIKHCNFTLQPVPYIHRPLLLYVANGLHEVLCNAICFRLHGFQFLEVGGVTYWIKQGANSSLPPLMFFHGISPGWSFYVMLIKLLSTDRTIIMVDLEAVKIKSMCFQMPSVDYFTDHVLHILKRHHIEKVSLVGHSFGTIIAGWVVSRYPHVVSHVTLLDPVSLLLALPDVAYSFVYRKPSNIVEWILYLFASREITISNMLHRHFTWHRNVLWLEDIPAHIGVVIGIGSRDEIANPAAIKEYTLQCQEKRRQERVGQEKIADIVFIGWDSFSHGQVLLVPSKLTDLQRILYANEKLCKEL